MKYCVGFCSKKPCNCVDILEVHNKFRREMLQCAQLREKGHKCTCIRQCNETSKYWEEQINKHTFENWYEANYASEILHQQKLKDIRKKVLKETGSTKYRWITISLPKESTPKEIYLKISSLVKNKPFRKHAYCMEFFGKDEQYHPHIHMVYERVGKPSHDNKAILRKFDIKPNFLDYQEINSDRLEEKLKYIKGDKQLDKLDQVEKDEILLKNNNLEKYYLTI